MVALGTLITIVPAVSQNESALGRVVLYLGERK